MMFRARCSAYMECRTGYRGGGRGSSALCCFPVLLGRKAGFPLKDGGKLRGIGEAAAVGDVRAAGSPFCQHDFRGLDAPADQKLLRGEACDILEIVLEIVV